MSGSTHVDIYIKKHRGQTQKKNSDLAVLNTQRLPKLVSESKEEEEETNRTPSRINFPNTRGLTATEICYAFLHGAACMKTYLL